MSTLTSENEAVKVKEGIYLYGVIAGCQEIDFGGIGITGERVYTISNGKFQAIVHRLSGDLTEAIKAPDVLEEFLLKHEGVLEKIQASSGTVLPAGFGTILKGEEEIRQWLNFNAASLEEKMKKVRDKNEYGIKIFCNMESIGEVILRDDEEVKKIQEKIISQSLGRAYLSKQKIEKLLNKKIEKVYDEKFKDFYKRISKSVSEVKIKKILESQTRKPMLMNLSVLAGTLECGKLNELLDEINKEEGFEVQFTGPWPPYAFV